VGTGHVDFLEVWKDVMDTYEVDRDHVYVSGHSMGGFGSFLLTVLYPDRFAAGVPVSPPVTQGAWTGIDFGDMCDEWTFEEYSFCYIQANQGNARAQHTRKLLGNLRHVPLAIFAGVQDELVPFLGVARQAEQLTLLGYRHRLYANVVAEHYTPPVLDQWAEVAEYEHTFTRPENPAQVTYMRDMPFERATELSRSENIPLSFTFDSAYWMSELHAPDSEAEAPTGVASFDGRSLAISAAEDQWAAPHLTLPDSDTPTGVGQFGPHVVTGLQWIDDPTNDIILSNAFEATLTGADRVRLDLGRMGIDSAAPIAGTVSTNVPLTLRLDGDWASAPIVTVGGAAVETTLDDGVVTFTVPVGTDLAITVGEQTLEGAF
jgi:pimeloyl-ACP methyl ester carboxylesterase